MKIKLATVIFTGILFSSQLAANPYGVYDIKARTAMGDMESVLTLNEDGSGSVVNMMGQNEFAKANIDGNSFNFTMMVKSPMGEIEMHYQGTVDGDSITGNMNGPMGGARFTGSRQ